MGHALVYTVGYCLCPPIIGSSLTRITPTRTQPPLIHVLQADFNEVVSEIHSVRPPKQYTRRTRTIAILAKAYSAADNPGEALSSALSLICVWAGIPGYTAVDMLLHTVLCPLALAQEVLAPTNREGGREGGWVGGREDE